MDKIDNLFVPPEAIAAMSAAIGHIETGAEWDVGATIRAIAGPVVAAAFRRTAEAYNAMHEDAMARRERGEEDWGAWSSISCYRVRDGLRDFADELEATPAKAAP